MFKLIDGLLFFYTYKQTQQPTSPFTCQFGSFRDAFINWFWKTVDEFFVSIAHKITQCNSDVFHWFGLVNFYEPTGELPNVWNCTIVIFLFSRKKK